MKNIYQSYGKQKRNFSNTIFGRHIGILTVLMILLVIGTSMHENFLTFTNITNIIRQATPMALLALGMTFVILTGGIDLSVAAVMVLASCIAADVLNQYGDIAAIIVSLLVGLVCGLTNGLIITRFKVAPFIITLGIMNVAKGLTLVYTGAQIIVATSPLMDFIGYGKLFGVPTPIYILIVAFIIMLILEKKTVFG